MQTEEILLIKRIVAGDTESFAALADRYSRSVYSLTARIAGSAEDAEELTQDTFLKAFDSLGRFDGRSAFATWLYRIACNTGVAIGGQHALSTSFASPPFPTTKPRGWKISSTAKASWRRWAAP